MASLLPNGKQYFTDDNGKPLVGGMVDFYIPNTSTRKNTYQDQAQTILNTNPIVLDSRGEATIWGTGSYRQRLLDRHGNLIWDKITSDLSEAINALEASLAAPGGSDLIGFIQAGAGAVPRTLQEKDRDTISVKDFGATGDGMTVDTAALQKAIEAAYGKTLLFTAGTYLSAPLQVEQPVTFQGAPGATLKLIDGRTAQDALLNVTGTSTKFKSYGMTYDGNEAGQGAGVATYTIRFFSIGTQTAPSEMLLRDNTFINGNYSDIVAASDSEFTTKEIIDIQDNLFLGGREGTADLDMRVITVTRPMDINISNNFFDFQRDPTTFGRAGIVCTVSDLIGNGSRGHIADNTLVNMGRSSSVAAHGTVGAIDCYYGANDISIIGNSLLQPWGRGIAIKAEASNTVIAGNTIRGLGDLTSGAAQGAQIVVNGSVGTLSNGTVAVTGNTCFDSDNDGMSFSGFNSGGNPVAIDYVIANNVVTLAARRGIQFQNAKVANISGNIIDRGCTDGGIYLSDSPDTVSVLGNTCKSLAGSDLVIIGPPAGIVDVSNNRLLSASPYSYSGTDVGLVRFANNSTVAASPASAYAPQTFATSAQIDWVNGSANQTINTTALGPGTYNIELEGDCVAGAGGIFLVVGSGFGLTASLLRATSQLWNGTTLANSTQTNSSGVNPSVTAVAYSNVCTHYRIVATIVVTVAGQLNFRGAQNSSNAATTSVLSGATMRVTRTG
jgi:hypothetical protein